MDHNYEESYRAMCAEAFSCSPGPPCGYLSVPAFFVGSSPVQLAFSFFRTWLSWLLKSISLRYPWVSLSWCKLRSFPSCKQHGQVWFLMIPQKQIRTQSPGLYGQARATKRYIPGTSGMSINASMMKSFGKLVGHLGLEPDGTGGWWVAVVLKNLKMDQV